MTSLIKLIVVSFLIISPALCEEEDDEEPKLKIEDCRCLQKYGYVDRGKDTPVAITTAEIVKINGKEECRCNIGASFLSLLKQEKLDRDYFENLHKKSHGGPFLARSWLKWHHLKVKFPKKPKKEKKKEIPLIMDHGKKWK